MKCKRLLSVLLTVLLTFTALPERYVAMAQEDEDSTVVIQETEETEAFSLWLWHRCDVWRWTDRSVYLQRSWIRWTFCRRSKTHTMICLYLMSLSNNRSIHLLCNVKILKQSQRTVFSVLTYLFRSLQTVSFRWSTHGFSRSSAASRMIQAHGDMSVGFLAAEWWSFFRFVPFFGRSQLDVRFRIWCLQETQVGDRHAGLSMYVLHSFIYLCVVDTNAVSFIIKK